MPASQAIATALERNIGLMMQVAENSRRMMESVPSDANTMNGLKNQLEALKGRYNGGNGDMTATEFSRRAEGARDQAANNLIDPKKYTEELGRWRAFNAEREHSSRETDQRIAAGGASMLESFSSGIDKATQAWGNFDQQVQAAGTRMMNVLSDGLSTALVDVVTGTKSASEAFRDMAATFLREIASMIIKLLIQLAVQLAINAATGKSSNYNFSNILSNVMGSFGGGVTAKASGGMIYGGHGAIDDVPAMLTAGEYVINRDAVRALGIDTLDQMNSSKGYASGGRVGYGVSGPGSNRAGGGNVNVGVNVNVNSGGESNIAQDKRKQKQLGETLDAAVRAVIIREKRAGGLLT